MRREGAPHPAETAHSKEAAGGGLVPQKRRSTRRSPGPYRTASRIWPSKTADFGYLCHFFAFVPKKRGVKHFNISTVQ